MAIPRSVVAVALVVIVLAAALLLYEPSGKEKDEEAALTPAEEVARLIRFDGENIQVMGSDSNTCETTIQVNPTDPQNLVYGANDYTTPNGDCWCGAYWSRDGGKTWGQTLIPGYRGGPLSLLSGYGFAGDPVVVFDPDGNCYLAGLAARRKPLSPFQPFEKESTIFVAKSTDGGETWGQVQTLLTARTKDILHDKEWITVDPNDGTLYVTWTLFNFGAGTSHIVCSRSTNGGLTWGDYAIVSDIRAGETQVQGSYPVVDDDGTLHVVWLEYEGSTVRYAQSKDKGQTFSAPIDVAPLVPMPTPLSPHTYRTPTMPAIDVDRSGTNTTGSLYIVWPDYATGDADILLSYSRDGGGAWSAPVRVNNDNASNGVHQFFPSVTVTPQGYVAVAFYDMRDDPDSYLLHLYLALSADGGQTFPLNMNVTNTMFDGEGSGGSFLGAVTSDSHTGFIGDYIQLDSDEAGIYASWCDCRNGSVESPNSDAYFAKIDIVQQNATAGGADES